MLTRLLGSKYPSIDGYDYVYTSIDLHGDPIYSVPS